MMRFACLLLTGILLCPSIARADLSGLMENVERVQSLVKELGFTPNPQQSEQEVLRAYAATFDPDAAILTTEETEALQQTHQGSLTGFGFMFSSTGSAFLVSGYADAAPAKDVIPTGSTLLAVGTNSVEKTSFDRLLHLLEAAPSPAVIRYRDPQGEVHTNEVTEAHYQQPAIALAEDLPATLAYLRLNGLYPGSSRELISTIRGWSETDRYGFIIDLRHAGGDDIDAVQALASLFVSEGTFLFAFRDADDQDLATFKANAGGPIRPPVMLLIDEHTTGAAELLAAVLSGNARGAMLIGRPTQGDPLIREIKPIDDNLSLRMATRKVVTEDGQTFHIGDTVNPHIIVKKTAATPGYEPKDESRKITLDEEIEDRHLRDRVRYDPALRRAVDLLLGLKALNIQRTSSP